MTTTDHTPTSAADAVLAEPTPTPQTGRVQLALNVDDLQASIAFYSQLFDAAPAKVRPGYANFSLARPALKLVLIENPGKGGSVNHLGVEVVDSATVHEQIARLSAAGLITEEEMGTTCCFATQDKVWVTGPAGERWEVYTVLADSPTYGTNPTPTTGAAGGAEDGCCATTTSGGGHSGG